MLQSRVLSGQRAAFRQQPLNTPCRSRRPLATVAAKVSLAPLVDQLKADQLKPGVPEIHIGDSVRLGVVVQEGKGKTRQQRLDGTVIAMAGSGSNKTVTVRRIFQGVGIEMVFQPHSQVVGSVEVMRRGKVRRSKLYYLRERTGKNARLKELITKKAE